MPRLLHFIMEGGHVKLQGGAYTLPIQKSHKAQICSLTHCNLVFLPLHPYRYRLHYRMYMDILINF